MTRFDCVLLGLALVASLGGGWWLAHVPAPAPASVGGATAGPQRIVSASTIADQVLPQLVAPQRIVAASAWHKSHHPLGFQLAGAVAIPSLDDLELILSLRPDVVLVSGVHDQRRVQRLRDAGLIVVDTGPMTGAAALHEAVRVIGAAVGEPERAAAWLAGWQRRFDRVAAGVTVRPRALALSSWAGDLSGMAAGSSMHEVLLAAGCEDAAVDRTGWPTYSPEAVIAMRPEVVVCPAGHAPRIRALPGLGDLPARYVELPESLFSDAGPLMLDAAEYLYGQIHAAAR